MHNMKYHYTETTLQFQINKHRQDLF